MRCSAARPCGASGRRARQALTTWWSINNRADALRTLDWLRDTGQRTEFAAHIPPETPVSLLAWDACRLVWVAGKSYVAGYLHEDEAWGRIMPAAKAVQAAYKSWPEVGEAYLQGRALWRGQRDAGAEAVCKLLANPKDPRSPWNINSWDTKLNQ